MLIIAFKLKSQLSCAPALIKGVPSGNVPVYTVPFAPVTYAEGFIRKSPFDVVPENTEANFAVVTYTRCVSCPVASCHADRVM